MSAAVPLTSDVQSFLQLTAIRQLAVDGFGGRLVVDSALVTRLWYQLVSEEADITILHCTIRWMGRKYVLGEYVSGETLEELVKRSDPAACEREIPLFCKLLDAFEGNAIAPAPRSEDFELVEFGIDRVAKPLISRAHGAALAGPGGSWAEESFGGTAEISLALKEFCENLMAPKPLPAPVAAPTPRARRVPSWLVAGGTAAVLLVGLYGMGSFLAGRTGQARAHVTPPASKAAATEPLNPVSGIPIPTGTVTFAGGPKPVTQTPLVYPEAARRQWITGVVELELALGSDGSVESATVKNGDPALAPGLTEAVKAWVFRPLRAQGKAISGTAPLKLRFDLKP